MCRRAWLIYVVHGVVSSSGLLLMFGETAVLYFAPVALSFVYGIRYGCRCFVILWALHLLCVWLGVGGGKSEKRKRARVSNLVYPFSDFFKI